MPQKRGNHCPAQRRFGKDDDHGFPKGKKIVQVDTYRPESKNKKHPELSHQRRMEACATRRTNKDGARETNKSASQEPAKDIIGGKKR
jgi:hypothetical protein